MKTIRLNKYLSDCGICSRRKADEHILAGNVLVNEMAPKIGTKINSEKDEVTFDGKVVKALDNLVYYALYKPKGVISTASDESDRETVVDLVPKEPRVYPVGRLDEDSLGLIILTNDGELTNLLTHPSFKHEKEYEALVSCSKYQVLSIDTIRNQFLSGININGKLMKADEIEISKIRDTRYKIRITIHTGYNRQIRKMCAKMGFEVISLTRIRIGNLKLADLELEPGEFKEIDKKILNPNF